MAVQSSSTEIGDHIDFSNTATTDEPASQPRPSMLRNVYLDYKLWVNQQDFRDHPHEDPNSDVVPDMVVRPIKPVLPFQVNLEEDSNFNRFKRLVYHQLARGDHNPGIPIRIVVSNADENYEIEWFYSIEEDERSWRMFGRYSYFKFFNAAKTFSSNARLMVFLKMDQPHGYEDNAVKILILPIIFPLALEALLPHQSYQTRGTGLIFPCKIS
ncbi:hypothetical protein PGTUg99_013413 [Puccinia graminis f. sp. tritici]|uniref:Uncharacterized protein n=1 Tax=Puccinia graminis f. sp. tritici TaxID=56615 RepID=A0A5B0M500_PUCGR|nr:hypothetical protein PGTUg99_013413 [Puccinia graminis f. sp. tritici]